MIKIKFIANKLALLVLVLATVALTISRTLIPVSAGFNTCTWTGEGENGNFNNSANWVCDEGTIPDNGYELYFPYLPTKQEINNNLEHTYIGLLFEGDAPLDDEWEEVYEFSGNALKLAGDLSVNIGESRSVTITSLTLESNSDFLVQGGSSLYIGDEGVLSIDANNLFISAAVSIFNLAGTGTLTAEGGDPYGETQSSYVGSSPDFAGDIIIDSGLVNTVPEGFGTTAGNTHVRQRGTYYSGRHSPIAKQRGHHRRRHNFFW